MSTLAEKAAAAKAEMDKQNPSNSPEKPAAERVRVPLHLPVQKLQVPEIPGYHLHWFRGSPQRIHQAERAGFVFVAPDEVALNSTLLGGDANHSGNTDMGSRVSIVSGDVDDSGQAVRLYLMKQKMEHYLEDRKMLEERNDSIADSLTESFRSGAPIANAAPGEARDDVDKRYVNRQRQPKVPDLFRRKARGK